jgi:hypothetical protein
MKRIFRFRTKSAPAPAVAFHFSPQQQREMLDLLSDIGLHIVHEARGPVPLMTFGRRVLERLGPGDGLSYPLPQFADALKRVIREMRHDRLQVMAPSDFMGVGYVFNAQDPDTWPVRSSR